MSVFLNNNKIEEGDDQDYDFEFDTPNTFFGANANMIPLASAVQAPRIFYGTKFYNQALPLKNREEAYVQNLSDRDGVKSYDELNGKAVGARFADEDGEVLSVDKDYITYKNQAGEKKTVDLYNNFYFNRKTAITNKALVKAGDKIKKGGLLASSNYTDDKGVTSMGVNARIGVVPYKGGSIDDAIVISEDFAKRIAAEHTYKHVQDFDKDVKKGKNHFKSLFPEEFTKDQLSKLDDDGAIQVGQKVSKGDPLILATSPRVISSTAQLGKLSKSMMQARSNSSQTWDHDYEGVVTDVAHTKKGTKVYVSAVKPAKIGDKIVIRNGQKDIISAIIPQHKMLRTNDGRPMDVLLNPLSMPSRANNASIYEMLLGKVAEKRGKKVVIPAFLPKGQKWHDYVRAQLEENGLDEDEEVYDPELDKKLENRITVGNGYVLKLHHTADSKESSRGQGSYDLNEQPTKGGFEGGQSKRLSGLEVGGLLSSGAYANLREAATLRGQRNDDYWRTLRQGYTPKNPGTPFVFDKFKALLTGAGLNVQDRKDGKLRLGVLADKDLDALKPVEVKNGNSVNLKTLEPIAGGLFDKTLVSGNRWGKISLSTPLPNPAAEDTITKLLGLTKKEYREVLAGKRELG